MEHKDCVFCFMDSQKIVLDNGYAQAFFDQYPVNHGHMLIVPKRHVDNYFGLYDYELKAINLLTEQARKLLVHGFKAEGFNLGWNCGAVAGQTIFHAHMHIIPRYKGDVENPKGGIRNFKESLVKY